MQAFFSSIPQGHLDEAAFVLVQHLAPDHKSVMAELIKRVTWLRVMEVQDGMVAAPGCVFLIPPNRDMEFVNGTLQLSEPLEPRGQRLPIDFFFRSLALDQHDHGVCIVLSGTGSDGTLGVRAVKAEGGMAIAQLPESCEYDSMPRNAIATGLVDYVLAPEKMPAQLDSYFRLSISQRRVTELLPGTWHEDSLKKIFGLLRLQIGHDFSKYKRKTIVRRVQRRMVINHITQLEDYARFLQRNTEESEALFRDLLIGVTTFFRDAEAFRQLSEQAISPTLLNKASGETVRVWVPGCASGEEAYSLAILLEEQMSARKQNFKVQLFATDLEVWPLSGHAEACFLATLPLMSPQNGWRGSFRNSPIARSCESIKRSATC